MAAPKLALRKLADLGRDPRNARTHSPEQVAQIVASIRRFGWTNPVMVVGSTVYAGNGRHMAAEAIYADGDAIYMAPGPANGGTELPPGTIPVLDCTGWSETERAAYALGDNKIALNAGWDDAMLKAEIAALAEADFTIGDLGFDAAELHKLLGMGGGSTDPDEVPEVPEVPTSVLGDVWILGDHRIICGSSTNPDDVAAVLGEAKPHLMVTDPPYGVEYDANWRNGTLDEATGVVKGRTGSGGRAVGKVLNDDRVDWTEAWALFPGDVAYVWHAPTFYPEVAESLENVGLMRRQQIVWAKQHLVIGRADYHWQHELCAYHVRKGRPGQYVGGRKQATVWNIDKPHRSETGHSTQKPLECMQRPIENNSQVGDAVYEPFSGSGTTIMAGQITGRKVYAVELNPAYVDVAVTRWQEYTKREAVLEATGQTFYEVKAERA